MLRRCEAYLAAGVDMLMITALQSREEIRTVREAFPEALIKLNISIDPPLTESEFRDFRISIYDISISKIAQMMMFDFLTRLRRDGIAAFNDFTQAHKGHPIGMFGFLELTGFPKLLEIERAFLMPARSPNTTSRSASTIRAPTRRRPPLRKRARPVKARFLRRAGIRSMPLQTGRAGNRVTAFRPAELWFGAGLVLLAIGVAVEGSRVTAGFGYDTVGPRAFPYLIAAGLLASGTAIVAHAFPRGALTDKTGGRHWLPVVAISAVLVAQVFLIGAARLDPGEHRRVRGGRLRFRQPRAVAQPVVRRRFGRCHLRAVQLRPRVPASGRQRRRGPAVASARLGSGRVGWRP